jgi:hypothetical protein
MDDAVDAFVEKKFGSGGTFARDCSGIIPFKDWDKIQPGYQVPSETAIQITKDYCNYIFDTFGRFPATYDTIIMPEWVQVHHLEEEFYDKYGRGGLVNETHRGHMGLWHR